MKIIKLVFLAFALVVSLSSYSQEVDENLKLFRSGDNRKWGYYNEQREIVIEPKFDWAEPFSNGVAKIIENGDCGVINKAGSYVLEPYSWSNYYSDRIGDYIIEKDGYGYRIVYYDESNGTASRVYNKVLSTKKNCGAFENCYYDCVYHLGGGMLAVRVDDPQERKSSKWGLMRIDGQTVSRAKYDAIGDPNFHHLYLEEDFRFHPRMKMQGFSDGLCPVRKNGKSGYIDTTGKLVIDIKYDEAKHFSEGLAAVRIEKKGWGYINTRGEWVIEPKYYEAGIFSEGLAGVIMSDWKAYYIDKDGAARISVNLKDAEYLKYDICERSVIQYVGAFENGLAPLIGYTELGCSRPIWGGSDWVCKIDKKGRGYDCDSFYMVELGLVAVKSDGLWGLIDTEGNDVVVPFSIEKPVFDKTTGLVRFADQYYDRNGELRNNAPNNIVAKSRFYWPYIPSSTNQSRFSLNAEIKSASKIDYCKVYLNGMEVQEDDATGGSSIVEDQKGDENHDININRTLVLREGKNTIGIKVKNAGGEKEEEKTIEYNPDKTNQEKAIIVWNDIPATTIESQLELDATVKSTVREVYCRVLLNGVEVSKTKGSSIVEDSKEIEYKYKLSVTRTIVLQEGNNGDNIITIEVRNAKGELVATDQKHVTYIKPALATIEWGDVPSYTEEKQFILRAKIISDTPIEYYSILKNGKVLKKVIINVAAKGSSIAEDPKKGSDYNVQVNDIVELAEGDNSFVIEVKNAGGVVRTQTKTVRHKYKEKRIALVIGNEAYDDERMRLTCPSNDANAVAARYGQLGFDEVILRENLPKKEMQALINEFRSKSMNYDAVVVYYSGHGVQVNQINYMIPTDFDFSNGSVTNDCVAVTYLLRDLGEDRMKIVVYDACRTQPRPKGDITDIDVLNNVNTFIAYASSVGQPSYEDSDSPYSIYTAAFLKVLDEPNLKLGDVFSKVNRIVRQKTSNMNVKQVPYIEGSVDKDFIFNKKESR